MAISEKTRKMLWAKSGNRCAICKIELITEQKTDSNLNIGEECHIISSKSKGPRHKSNLNDYDSFDNLILLCRNHHKTIDELWETYTVELCKHIKMNHEHWIKSVLDNANGNKSDEISILPRLITGQQIVDIMKGALASKLTNDEPSSQEEVNLLGAFLENISDWIDIIGMDVFEKGQEIQLAFDMNKNIRELEDKGFSVFGEKMKIKEYYANGKYDILDVAVISLVRNTNPAIINFSELAVKFAEIKKV